ncbi:MAG: hypothetical protein ACE15D_18615 [Candidatus Eisenbacteria bacterium]
MAEAIAVAVIFWLVGSGVNAAIASAKHRSAAGVFFFSLLVSPLFGFMYILAVPALAAPEPEEPREWPPMTEEELEADKRRTRIVWVATCVLIGVALAAAMLAGCGEDSPSEPGRDHTLTAWGVMPDVEYRGITVYVRNDGEQEAIDVHVYGMDCAGNEWSARALFHRLKPGETKFATLPSVPRLPDCQSFEVSAYAGAWIDP